MPTTKPSLDILIVDDEPNIRRTLSLQLVSQGHRPRTAATAEEALRELEERRFDVVLLDLRLGASSGLDLLPRMLAEAPALKVVAITAYASVETAVEAMRRGARDYLSKPFSPQELDLALEKMAELGRLESKVQALERSLAEVDPAAELRSSSPAMLRVLQLARQVAGSEIRILLRGESGTGKGVLARAVHDWSPRRDKPFVVIPCPALPAELLESELFGHVRGAFTGASRDNQGRVSIAEGGTLVLDEIGELPLPLQPKLLRFIQDRIYERVGDPAERHADIRILAATNQDLEEAVRQGRFREDLLYRLNVITLELPPLRERTEDLLPLAESFLAFFGRQHHRPAARFSQRAAARLREHAWPGNVRELRNAVERAVMLSERAEIDEDLLLLAARPASLTSGGTRDGGTAVGELVALSRIEDEHIRRVLARTPSIKEAASVLGIDQATLWRWRKQHGD